MASSKEQPKRRGRPKGTGLDDSAILRKINILMAADKYLKPTTAIHRAGINDPSVVRRLREKLKTDPKSAPLKRAEPRAQSKPPAAKVPPQKTARAIAAKPDNPAKAPPPQPEPPAQQPAPQTAQPKPRDPHIEAMRLSADAAAAVSRLYLHILANAAAMNPLSMAMNSQNFTNRWLTGLMTAQMGAFSARKPNDDTNGS